MHLVGPYLTTTNSRKRKVNKTPGLDQAKAEHDAWVAKFCKSKNKTASTVKTVTKVQKPKTAQVIPSLDTGVWTAAKKAENQYTGTEIIGISVMHKSNAVPIRGKKQAEEIARMRR
jgi:peroxiredoxin